MLKNSWLHESMSSQSLVTKLTMHLYHHSVSMQSDEQVKQEHASRVSPAKPGVNLSSSVFQRKYVPVQKSLVRNFLDFMRQIL